MGNESTIDAGGPRAVDASPHGPSGVYAHLVVRAGDETRVFDLREGDELVLGRGDDAAIQIDDAKASREHARLACRAGAITLTDLGSRNGTHLNHELVRDGLRPLTSGDVFWIGDTEILVAGSYLKSAAASAPPGTPPSAALDIPGMVVADAGMVEVFQMIDRVAPRATTVLLLGETGVGKELVAERIHARSDRATGPLVRINCGALPENLLESELFGYERGAFTGAERRKLGLLETASGGTLFLDEIGELRVDLQTKLLRALEARTITRLGGRDEIAVDLRIIAATNRDLEEDVKRGSFRSDLFFRISAFTIKIPPLRERPNEIALLAELFVRQLSVDAGRLPPRLTPAARAVLERHTWPGNVRELRNVIERALVMTDSDQLAPEHFPDALRKAATEVVNSPIKARMESTEQRAIEDALAAEKGNQTRAARRLGVSRRTLLYKLAKYRLRPRDRDE